MQFITTYQSPLGTMLIACDDIGLTGLWFEGGKYYALGLEENCEERETAVFVEVKRWLDIYFAGKEPDFMPSLHLIGTPFQMEIWRILQRIPYGEMITYGDIAKEIAKKRGLPRMSAQAVGGAVGHNKISIIIPCHRVVGMNGSLTGYAGGLDKKCRLLELEGVDMSKLSLPKRGIHKEE